jgi:arabinogalactan oligomer / maltooligosaccharide transport system substrate-binding protein
MDGMFMHRDVYRWARKAGTSVRLLGRSLTMLVLVLVVACGSPAASVTPTMTAPVSPPAPQTITLWHSWSGRGAQTLDMLARRYEQQHPDVRIVLESHPASSFVQDYTASVSDGSAPQIVLVLSRYVRDLAARSQVLPLDDRFPADRLEGILPAALDSARVNGQLYAVPLTFDGLVLFYDRRLVPEVPSSIEQLLSTANSVPDGTGPNPALAYYLSAATTLPYLRAFDGAIFNSEGRTILDGDAYDGTVRWLEWLQTIRADSRAIATDDWGAVDGMIQANRVPAVIDWSHRLADYQQLWGRESVGIAALPRIDDADPAPSIMLTDALGINPVTTGQQRAIAADFVRFMLSSEAQGMVWSRGEKIPVNQNADVDGAAKDLLAIGGEGFAFPSPQASTRSWPLLDAMIRGVLSGSATPAEAIEAATAGLRALESAP